MFKKTPLKKAKELSENLIGRFVELDGKYNDDNKQIENFLAVTETNSTPIRNSIANSGKKLRSLKKSSKRTTGRKLIRNLFCTPGKARSFPETSVEDLDDFVGCVHSRSFIVDHYNTVRELEQTSSDFSMPSSPPRLARKLLEDHDTNTDRSISVIVSDSEFDNLQNMKTIGKEPSEDKLSSTINSSRKVEAALVAASNFSDKHDDMLFLTNSSSSDDEFDHGKEDINETNGSISDRTALEYASPPKFQDDHHSSLSNLPIPMKSPGIGIPTPAITKLRETSSDSYTEDYSSVSNLPFPHPLRNIPDSPTTTSNPKNLSTQFEEEDDDDDDAFLPDDFKPNKSKQVFTLDEVDQMVKDARREERMCLRHQHEKDTDDLQNEFDKIMVESGSQWKRDADEESARYERLLKEEKRKTSQKHHELINKEQSLEDVKYTLNEIEIEREFLRLQVSELETAMEKMSTDASNKKSKIEEIESLQKAKSKADDDQILGLERELSDNKVSAEALQRYQGSNEELTQKLSAAEKELVELRIQNAAEADQMITLKHGKEMIDQEVVDLSERLRARVESNNQSLNRLEETEKEITQLKTQLVELSSKENSSSEETRLSNIKNEKLKILRVEDEKEIEALQVQLSRMEEEHRAVFSSIEEEHQRAVFTTTPQKSLNSSRSESSPCYEIDILRVDNDKAHDQLKAMGKVLKRYKYERDDVKSKIKELEQRQIQTIEIAVKQATQDQKEKIEILKEENEALLQKPIDIGDKMMEEMKEHIEELKKRHIEEITQIKESSERMMDNDRAELEEQHNMLEAQFQLQTKELIESHKKKIDSLLLEIEQIRTNHEDEVALTKSKSRKEIDGFHEELRRIKIEFENEKVEIIKIKSKESEELEGQIEAMHEMHGEELELVQSENRGEIDNLRDKLDKLQKEFDARPSEDATKEIMKTIKSKFEEDLEQLKGTAKSDTDRLQSEIDSLIVARDSVTQKVNKLESQKGEIQERNTAKTEKDKNEYDHRIREIRAEHAREGDELLAQLDLIEAEADERCKNTENAVKNKDAVIAAMGSQLAESTQQHDMLRQKIEPLRNELEAMNVENRASQQKISKLIMQHSKEIDDQIILREKACNEAREEMIEMAEKQLDERQEYYKTIKKELDNAQSKISVLDRDLRFTKKELDEMSRRHQACEADLKDELAQAKALGATSEANQIRAERAHRAELNQAKDAGKTMKSKLEESQAISQSVQKTLAALVTEKERISQELVEVTAISEELACLLEEKRAS